MNAEFIKTLSPNKKHSFLFVLSKNKYPHGHYQRAYQRTYSIDQTDIIYNYINDYDIYMSTASYEEENGQLIPNKDNFLNTNNLYIDIDVKEGNPRAYTSLKDAKVAIYNCLFKKLGLEPTYIVESGTGYHIHYALEHSISIEEYNHLTTIFYKFAESVGLKVDINCLLDPTRRIRLPGTINHKNGSVVKLAYNNDIKYSVVYLIEEFKKHINEDLFKFEKNKKSSTYKNIEYKEKHSIAKKYYLYEGLDYDAQEVINNCSLFQEAINNPHSISEPVWRGILSILIRCKDGEEWCHRISSYDNRYNKQETDHKIKYLKEKDIGPYKYSTFEELGVTFATPVSYNKNSSPIILGRIVNTKLFSSICPCGYKIEDNKIYYIEKNKKNKDEIEILLLDGELYPLPTDYANQDGTYMVQFYLKLPNRTPSYIDIQTKDLYNNEKMRSYLGGAKLTTNLKSINRIIEYMRELLKLTQSMRKEIKLTKNFGWTDVDKEGYATFLIGDKLYSKNTPEQVFISNDLKNYSQIFRQKGSLKEATTIFSYLNSKRLKDQMFAMLIPFASPLMEFTPIHGCWIHLKGKTGTGKTTTQRMMNSIYGHPDLYMNSPKDSQLAIEKRWEIYKNLHFSIDETTLMNPSLLNDLLFRASQGSPKSKLSKESKEILSTIRSKLFVVSSSNNSIMDQIISKKKEAEAESKRIIEIQFGQRSTTSSECEEHLNKKCMENYGVLGHWYLDKLCKGTDYQIRNVIDKNKKLLLETLGEKNQERFWINGISTILAAFDLLKHWKIIDWDKKDILDYIYIIFKTLRNEAKEYVVDSEEIINEIINNNLEKTVEVEKRTNDPRETFVTMKDISFAKEIAVRIEKISEDSYMEEHETNIFITLNFLKDYLFKNKISYMSFIEDLNKKNLLHNEKIKVRLLANTKYSDVSRRQCIHIKYVKKY